MGFPNKKLHFPQHEWKGWIVAHEREMLMMKHRKVMLLKNVMHIGPKVNIDKLFKMRGK